MMPPKDAFTKEELQVTSRLRQMKLSGMADALENQLRDPNADLASFMDRIIEIVNTEWQNRYDKKFSRFLKQAKLRYPAADLDESIYDPPQVFQSARESPRSGRLRLY